MTNLHAIDSKCGAHPIMQLGIEPLDNLTVILRYSQESASIDICARFCGVPQNDTGVFKDPNASFTNCDILYIFELTSRYLRSMLGHVA